MKNVKDEPILDLHDREYRPNVAAVILSSQYPMKCEFFLARRNDIKNAWQFPQGGIDKNETPKEALLRELKEEIGTDNIEIIAEYPKWLRYKFPATVNKKMYPFLGQEQRYFLVRLKNDKEINLATPNPEFNKFVFASLETILKKATSFKKQSYKQVLYYFKSEGYI